LAAFDPLMIQQACMGENGKQGDKYVHDGKLQLEIFVVMSVST
jgi:hypothetical protein